MAIPKNAVIEAITSIRFIFSLKRIIEKGIIKTKARVTITLVKIVFDI